MRLQNWWQIGGIYTPRNLNQTTQSSSNINKAGKPNNMRPKMLSWGHIHDAPAQRFNKAFIGASGISMGSLVAPVVVWPFFYATIAEASWKSTWSPFWPLEIKDVGSRRISGYWPYLEFKVMFSLGF